MVYWSDYRPSKELLRYSFRKRSSEYIRENTVHGVSYPLDPTKSIYERNPRWFYLTYGQSILSFFFQSKLTLACCYLFISRVLWLFLFIVSLVAAICTMVVIWEKFQTLPTITYLNINSGNNALDFPNVYLCFDQRYLNFSDLDLHPNQIKILSSLYLWKGETFSYESEYADWRGIKQKLFDALPECSDFFFNCEFGSEQYDCSDLFARKIGAFIGGVCCEFESRPIKKDDASWILEFEPKKYPLRMFFSGKYDGFPTKFRYIRNPLSVQMSLTITTTDRDVHFLSKSQRKCLFFEESRSHFECERKIKKDAFKSKCGCLPWFFAPYQFEECPVAKYACLARTMTALKAQKQSNCYIACDDVTYNIEKIEYTRNNSNARNTIQIGLSWPEVYYYRNIRFGWLDLLVSFGGVAGCFIGYSVITTFELIYYFTLRTYCGAVLSVPKTRFNITVQPAPGPMNKNIDSSVGKKGNFQKLSIAKI